MKTKTTLLSLLLMFVMSININAQATFPYYSGFDNAAETTGWTQQRMGSTANGSWTVVPSGGYSPAKCVSHYYPVGGSSVTDDWYISPALNLPAGGKIDSVRNYFSGFGMPNTSDTVAIYLLRGSPIPTLSSSDTMLFDFRGATYTNDAIWKLQTNILIPPVSGTCYIAFRYLTTINWLDVRFDNVKISSNSSAGINNYNTNNNITLFPNPVPEGQPIQIKNKYQEKVILKIYSVSGCLLFEKEISGDSDSQITMEESRGFYFYQIENKMREVISSGKLLIQ